MTFFKNLFGRNNKNANQYANGLNDGSIPPSDLFTEQTAPPENNAGNNTAPQKVKYRPASVHEFLSQDFWGLGHSHALQFPSTNRRDSAIKLLCTNYRQALDKAAQIIAADLEAHEQESLHLKGISDVVDHQMARRKQELQSLLQRVSQQLELSIDHEGWLAPAIAAYQDGFTQGTMEYMQQKDLLGGISILN